MLCLNAQLPSCSMQLTKLVFFCSQMRIVHVPKFQAGPTCKLFSVGYIIYKRNYATIVVHSTKRTAQL